MAGATDRGGLITLMVAAVLATALPFAWAWRSSGSSVTDAVTEYTLPADSGHTVGPRDLIVRPVHPRTVRLTNDEAHEFRENWHGDPRLAPDPAYRPIAHGRVRLAGRVWGVVSYENGQGDECLAEVVPGEGTFAHCHGFASLRAEGALHIHVSAGQRPGGNLERWDVVAVMALVTDRVRMVRVTLTDCSRRMQAVDRRVAYILFTRRQLYRGLWPYRVSALDEHGRVLDNHRARLGPPNTVQARRARVRAPEPSARCR